MIVLGYIGKHKGQGLRAWAGWALIRIARLQLKELAQWAKFERGMQAMLTP